MPKLWLFGEHIAVDTTVTLASGLEVSTALDGAQTTIRIAVRGAASTSALRFEECVWSFPCHVGADEVRLAETDVTALQGTMTLGVGASTGTTKPVATATPPGDHVGFVVIDRVNRAKTALFATSSQLEELLRAYNPGPWQRGRVRIDRRRVFIEPVVTGGDVVGRILDDRFGKTGGGGGAPKPIQASQMLRLAQVEVLMDRFTGFFEAIVGCLFVHPDVLDPRRLAPGRANALLYAHALAGGMLLMDARDDEGDFVLENVRYEGRNGAAVQLLLLALRDEHGHPLVVVVPRPIPLVVRRGLAAPSSPGDANDGATNRALVLGTSDDSPVLEGTLHAVDPIALLLADRRPEVTAIGTAPYWLVKGAVPVRPNAPTAIFGIAARTTFRRQANSQPLRAGVRLVPFNLGPVGLAFVFSELELEPTGWEIEGELPDDASVNLDAAGGAAPLPMRRRVARAREAPIRMPMVDTGWAFTGLPLSSPGGSGPSLHDRASRWVEALDDRLRTQSFESPTIEDYEHATGHRALPAELPFSRLLAVAPSASAVAPTPASTVLAGWEIAAPSVPWLGETADGFAPFGQDATEDGNAVFVFGGRAHLDGVTDTQDQVAVAVRDLSPRIEEFYRFWAGIDVAQGAWEARTALRTFLAGPIPGLSGYGGGDLSEEDEAKFVAVISRAGELADSNPPTELGLHDTANDVATMLPIELAELCADMDPQEPWPLIDVLQAPPTLEILRRAVAAVFGVNPDPSLKNYVSALRGALPADLPKVVETFLLGDANLPGLLADALQGVDGVMAYVRAIWNAGGTPILDDLRARYGTVFTDAVYYAVLGVPDDAAALCEALQELGIPLRTLADLVSEPPDHVFLTRRFRRPVRSGAGDEATALHPTSAPGAALWNHRFDLCKFGGGKAWDMFLDESSTVVVKLGGKRTLEAILREIQSSYATPGRPNPLGIVPRPGDPQPDLDRLVDDLPREVRAAEWRGAFVVGPMADLRRDSVLATLCGITDLRVTWAAVGGAKPIALADTHLAVWARISARGAGATWDTEKGEAPPAGSCDAGWSLIKFETVIRDSVIAEGEIAFRLNFTELLGRRTTWPPVVVSATLPPVTGEAAGKPRAFAFAATFENPLTFTINLAFLDSLDLRSIRVGSHQGDTVLDVDADLKFQQWPGVSIETKTDPLRLSDFRLRIPPLPDGKTVAIGVMRALSIDLPSVRFPIVGDRHLRFFGVEIRPVGVGILRGKTAIEKAFTEEWFPVGGTPAANEADTLPYVELLVTFGGMPLLGGASSQLSMRMIAGGVVKNGGTVGDPAFGISGLTGKNLRFDLFRLLTLTIEEIQAGRFETVDPDTNTPTGNIGALVVKNWNLRLLDWSILGENSKSDLLFAHDENGGEKRGMLAWLAREPDAGSFFRLHWVLLSRNLDPGSKLKTSLLERPEGSIAAEKSIVKEILQGTKLKVRVTAGQDWLFGIRFGLGELFEYCTLVLHDRHFYGIGLKAIWLKPLIGEDELQLAYIPGATAREDRFRVSFRLPALELVPGMRSGEIALEWSPSWDFLVDVGFPWRTSGGYDWFRAFSIPVGVYEAKFGFFIERRTTSTLPNDGLAEPAKGTYLTIGAGAGFYLGYYFGTGNGVAWVRAGIGVFGVLSGRATVQLAKGETGDLFSVVRNSLVRIEIEGALGIFAYGEGGIEIWIISARFRVSVQASITVQLVLIPRVTTFLTWEAQLAAQYSASVRVGSGIFSWTFSVSGAVSISVAGRAQLG